MCSHRILSLKDNKFKFLFHKKEKKKKKKKNLSFCGWVMSHWLHGKIKHSLVVILFVICLLWFESGMVSFHCINKSRVPFHYRKITLIKLSHVLCVDMILKFVRLEPLIAYFGILNWHLLFHIWIMETFPAPKVSISFYRKC